MFLKQLFLIIVLSINALHYSVLIHGSPLRYVVSWNHIAFNSKLPLEIQAHFHQLFLLFQEVTWPFILVYPQCYSYLLGWHSQFSILHFWQTLCHHNMFVWLYTSANHLWWCLILAGSQCLQPSNSFYCLSISSFLEVIA